VSAFSERLKELRAEKGLTQRKIAELLQVSQTGYANWEQGCREPDIDGIAKLALFFDVTAGYLLGLED